MVVNFNPPMTSNKILAKIDIKIGDESNRLRDQFNDIDQLSPCSDYSDTSGTTFGVGLRISDWDYDSDGVGPEGSRH